MASEGENDETISRELQETMDTIIEFSYDPHVSLHATGDMFAFIKQMKPLYEMVPEINDSITTYDGLFERLKTCESRQQLTEIIYDWHDLGNMPTYSILIQGVHRMFIHQLWALAYKYKTVYHANPEDAIKDITEGTIEIGQRNFRVIIRELSEQHPEKYANSVV